MGESRGGRGRPVGPTSDFDILILEQFLGYIETGAERILLRQSVRGVYNVQVWYGNRQVADEVFVLDAREFLEDDDTTARSPETRGA